MPRRDEPRPRRRPASAAPGRAAHRRDPARRRAPNGKRATAPADVRDPRRAQGHALDARRRRPTERCAPRRAGRRPSRAPPDPRRQPRAETARRPTTASPRRRRNAPPATHATDARRARSSLGIRRRSRSPSGALLVLAAVARSASIAAMSRRHSATRWHSIAATRAPRDATPTIAAPARCRADAGRSTRRRIDAGDAADAAATRVVAWPRCSTRMRRPATSIAGLATPSRRRGRGGRRTAHASRSAPIRGAEIVRSTASRTATRRSRGLGARRPSRPSRSCTRRESRRRASRRSADRSRGRRDQAAAQADFTQIAPRATAQGSA